MIRRLREWARGHSERGRYSPVGIAFHWVMAFLILFQLGWGWWVSEMPVGGDKLQGYQVHSAVGLAVLVLAIARFGWRIAIPGPKNDADTQGWQTQVSYAIHYLFYIAFFALPLSGWAMWSSIAEPGPLYLGGVLPWPQLPLDTLPLELRWRIMDVAEDIHVIFVILLLIVIPLHVGASLKHHFWDRHDVLTGMLPEIPDEEDPQPVAKHNPRAPRIRPSTNEG